MPRRPALATAFALVCVPLAAGAAEPRQVVDAYADMALAVYGDSLDTARKLDAAIDAFLAEPDAAGLEAARKAWIAARVPYQQSEAYRFGNPAVDEWEGRVNAWPLDEGLIDYVDASLYGEQSDDNLFRAANVVARPRLEAGGRTIDASVIDATLLRALHEVDEVEANVATGYHAVEFLLWGQDLNGTGPGAGARPWTDYARKETCTGGNCERRAAYLRAASGLLVSDLEEMVAAWEKGGEARARLEGMAPGQGLAAMLTGMGSLSYGEQAGERMKLGLMLHDPEEEHDCFSDNTHNSHYHDGLGIENVYLGRYERPDGSLVQGPSLSDLVKARDPALDREMRRRLDATMAALGRIRDAAESGAMAYDQMLARGNEEGNAMIQEAIDALVAQTRTIERIVVALDLRSIAFEGSDSLDDPTAVFQ